MSKCHRSFFCRARVHAVFFTTRRISQSLPRSVPVSLSTLSSSAQFPRPSYKNGYSRMYSVSIPCLFAFYFSCQFTETTVMGLTRRSWEKKSSWTRVKPQRKAYMNFISIRSSWSYACTYVFIHQPLFSFVMQTDQSSERSKSQPRNTIADGSASSRFVSRSLCLALSFSTMCEKSF